MKSEAQKLEHSAKFWLVFELGHRAQEAEAIVAVADPTDVRRWGELGRQSFRNFERHVEGVIDGTIPWQTKPSRWKRAWRWIWGKPSTRKDKP